MKKVISRTLMAIIGSLALLFLGNFFFHGLLYLVYGSLLKFTSPVWLVLNGITIILCFLFVMFLKRERKLAG